MSLTSLRRWTVNKCRRRNKKNTTMQISPTETAEGWLLPLSDTNSTAAFNRSASATTTSRPSSMADSHRVDPAPGLPREIIDLISQRLDTNDIKVLSLTSKAMYQTLGFVPYLNYSSWKSHLCHIYRHQRHFFAAMCDRCDSEWRRDVMTRHALHKAEFTALDVGRTPPAEIIKDDSSRLSKTQQWSKQNKRKRAC